MKTSAVLVVLTVELQLVSAGTVDCKQKALRKHPGTGERGHCEHTLRCVAGEDTVRSVRGAPVTATYEFTIRPAT